MPVFGSFLNSLACLVHIPTSPALRKQALMAGLSLPRTHSG